MIVGALRKVKELVAPDEKIELLAQYGVRHQIYGYGKGLTYIVFGSFIAFIPWANFLPHYVAWLGIALSAIIGLLGLIILWQTMYRRWSRVYAFTDRRIIIVQGLIVHDSQSIDYFKVQDVSIDESFIEKMLFRTGDLKIRIDTEFKNVIHINDIEEYQQAQKIIYSHKTGMKQQISVAENAST